MTTTTSISSNAILVTAPPWRVSNANTFMLQTQPALHYLFNLCVCLSLCRKQALSTTCQCGTCFESSWEELVAAVWNYFALESERRNCTVCSASVWRRGSSRVNHSTNVIRNSSEGVWVLTEVLKRSVPKQQTFVFCDSWWLISFFQWGTKEQILLSENEWDVRHSNGASWCPLP